MMAQGFLAIFSDVEAGSETDYLHWLTREHAAERLGVPGFLAVRVFRAALPDFARYLIFYRLRDDGVAGSEGYLARLNAPTSWSQRIMPQLKNLVRGGGTIALEKGAGEGAVALPVLFEPTERARIRAAANDLIQRDRIVAARIFETDQSVTAIATNEKSMRQGDRSFAAMLLLEALDEDALRAAASTLGDREFTPFRQIFSMSNFTSQC